VRNNISSMIATEEADIVQWNQAMTKLRAEKSLTKTSDRNVCTIDSTPMKDHLEEFGGSICNSCTLTATASSMNNALREHMKS
jgi:hypothetical protein